MVKRKPLPDLLKGLAFVLMVQVHIMEQFALQDVYNSVAGKISLFLGGPFAAPLFLAVMGYFLAASKRTPKGLVIRGLKLILLALLLNIGLNFHLLIKIYSGQVNLDPWKYILGADILFVAGLSIIIVSFLKKIFKEKAYLYVLLSAVIPCITYFIPESNNHQGFTAYLGSFLWMRTDWSYFPLVPWFSYPLIGYGYYLVMNGNYSAVNWLKERKMALMFILAAVLVITSYYPFGVITRLHEYYHQGFLVFVWISVFLLFLVILLGIFEKEWGQTKSFLYLKWTGREVTAMYVIQWVIIGNLATSLYKTQFPFWLIVWFVAILAISSGLTYLYIRIRDAWKLKIID